MTNKSKLFSSLLTLIFAIFAGAVTITSFIQRNGFMGVFAKQNIDVDISVEIYNAGTIVYSNNNCQPANKTHLDVPNQNFCGAGEQNAIVYRIIIKNSTTNNIMLFFNELQESSMKNVAVKTNYILNNDSNLYYCNGNTLNIDDTLTINVTLFVKDAAFDAETDVNLNLFFENA